MIVQKKIYTAYGYIAFNNHNENEEDQEKFDANNAGKYQEAVWHIVGNNSQLRVLLSSQGSTAIGSNDVIGAADAELATDNYQYSFIIHVWTPYNYGNDTQTLINIEESPSRISKPKPIEFSLYKTTDNGSPLAGAKIKITSGTNISEINDNYNKEITSTADGFFKKFIITPKEPNGYVKLNISEIKAPDGYEEFQALTLTINYKNGKITSIDDGNSGKYASLVDGKNVAIKLKNEKAAQTLIIDKKMFDLNGNEINDFKDLKFKLEITGQNGEEGLTVNKSKYNKTLTDIEPNESGEIAKIEGITKDIMITIEETATKPGFTKINGNMYFYYKFDSATGGWNIESRKNDFTISNDNGDKNKKILTINNYENAEKTIIIQKKDADGNSIGGIGFDLRLWNIKSCTIGNDKYVDGGENDASNGKNGSILIKNAITDKNGEIVIKEITPYIFGDINENGNIADENDIELIEKYFTSAASNLEFYQEQIADINCDGKISYIDKTNKKFYERVYQSSIMTSYDLNDDGTYKNADGSTIKAISDVELWENRKSNKSNYSMIEIEATELESELYVKLEKPIKSTFYLIGKAIINEDSLKDNDLLIKYLTNSLEDTDKKLLEDASNSANISMIAVNTPKPYSLNIEKKDKFNESLGENYEFKITIDNATEIKYKNDTIKGNTIECTTDEKGKINIDEIYANSVDSVITIEETGVGNEAFTKIPTTTITKKGSTFTSSNPAAISVGNNGNLEYNLTVTDIPKLDFELIKKSTSNGDLGLSGAHFNIKLGSTELASDAVTNEDGKIIINNIDLSKVGLSKEMTLTLEETQAPEGFILPANNTTEVKIKCDKNGIQYNYNGNGYKKTENGKISVEILNGRTLPKILLFKTDPNDKALENVKFNISINGAKSATYNGNPQTLVSGDDLKLTGLKTDEYGLIEITDVIPNDENEVSNITVTVNEIATTQGLKLLTSPIIVKYSYNPKTGEVAQIDGTTKFDDENNGAIDVNSDIVAIRAVNYPVIDKLTLLKTDSLNGNNVDGAKFDIELINIKSCVTSDGTKHSAKENKITLKDLVTAGGQLALSDIIVNDVDSEIKINLKETEAPNGYKRIEDTISLTLKRGTDYKYTISKLLPSELGSAKIENDEIILNIKNIPTITLSGKVWEDGQTGVKNVQGPNGLCNDNEKLLKDIKVYLYNKDGSYTNEERTTDKNGTYEFKDIPKTNDGYYVVFEYNGIKYNNTVEGNESKATENSATRTTFNDRFKTIQKGQSNDGTPLDYTYNSNKTSTLEANIDGTNPASNDKDFKMQANTEIYTETADNINYGLVERYFDLSIGTDVDSATVTINGKEQKYDYNQILNENGDLELDNITQNISANDEPKYNLYLYNSDYNYRISDYKTGEAEGIQNTVNPNDNVNYAGNQGNVLEAYVTYKIILKNQSTHDAAVKEFVYYYDDIYEAPEVSGIDANKVTINIDAGNKKITFTDNGNELNVGNQDYRKEILITFKVKKDSNGNLMLKDNCTNVAEITKYSTTTGGLIDNDSAPDNANITRESGNLKVGQYEDDTDQAPGIKVAIKSQGERKITGTVFEDKNTDKENNDSTPVNDVIVQLIEIKKVKPAGADAKYCEYIWQETKSGSNTVKTTARNGYEGDSYNNSVTAESGQYEFTGFIPANYIIRFIYGDGRTYTITTNVEKYNGQDYKSTYDDYYKEQWYSNHGENLSVARDNEARRLEVMAYSVDIDKDVGEKLEQKTEDMLQNTWMAAETSKIDAKIESSEFNNMNFGLMERPKTKLTLEKHITSLKITPTGVGVQPIVDAKANIEQILGNTSITTQGLTDGLSTIKSTRDERGWWKVETDIEELAQGAKLEVEYTYVIKNESDDDYLNGTLVGKYEEFVKDDKIGEYSKYLIEMKKSVKNAMRSGSYSYSDSNAIGGQLGQYYYTGTKGNNERPILSQVETLEEALNNQLSYNEAITDQDFTKANTEKVEKTKYNTNAVKETISISTVIKNAKPSDLLETGKSDASKKVALETTLSSSSSGTIGGSYPSYIAQIVKYSNAAGRRNFKAIPGNLNYVHSDDTEMTMAKSNEADEFWGETITISKPTGEDKQFPVQIAIIVTSSIAVIGVGIILIKKFALKTK